MSHDSALEVRAVLFQRGGPVRKDENDEEAERPREYLRVGPRRSHGPRLSRGVSYRVGFPAIPASTVRALQQQPAACYLESERITRMPSSLVSGGPCVQSDLRSLQTARRAAADPINVSESPGDTIRQVERVTIIAIKR